jgi:hypothetical protein
MHPPGTVLQGTTTKHKQVIEILKCTTRAYRVRVVGKATSHGNQRGTWLEKNVLETQYAVVTYPRRRS